MNQITNVVCNCVNWVNTNIITVIHTTLLWLVCQPVWPVSCKHVYVLCCCAQFVVSLCVYNSIWIVLIIPIIIYSISFPVDAFDQFIFTAGSAHCYTFHNINLIVRIIINVDHITGCFASDTIFTTLCTNL